MAATSISTASVTQRGYRWVRLLARYLPRLTFSPLQIAIIYMTLATAALFVSDVLFVRYLSEPLLSQAQALKGGVEIVLTAGLIFVLTRRSRSTLEASNAELDLQREQLAVMHRVFRHNLRNDLNIIQGVIDMIREDHADAIGRECEMVLDTVEEMLIYTTRMKQIRKATEDDTCNTTYDLSERLPAMLDRHPLVTDHVTVTTEIESPAVVEANKMLEPALNELITNAIKHNDSETPTLTITVDAQPTPPGMVAVCIADNGPGIPEPELTALTESEEVPLVHLSGLGLWFVDWTVAQSNGRLGFTENAMGGTTVCVELPSRTASPRDTVARWLDARGEHDSHRQV